LGIQIILYAGVKKDRSVCKAIFAQQKE